MRNHEDGQQARDTAVAALDRAREKGPWMAAVFFPNDRGGVDCVVTTWQFQTGQFGNAQSAFRNNLDARDPTAVPEPLPMGNLPIPERAFRRVDPAGPQPDAARPPAVGPRLADVGEGDDSPPAVAEAALAADDTA